MDGGLEKPIKKMLDITPGKGIGSDGFDSSKRWGNSAIKGVGVNSPAMMKARAGFAKSSALNKKMGKEGLSSKESRASDRTAIMKAYGVKTDAQRASEKAALAKRKSDRGMFY